MSRGSRFIQIQNAVNGARAHIAELGRVGLLGSSKTGAASALHMPKTVSGRTMLARSLDVKSHTEYTWYKSLLAKCFSSARFDAK